MSERVKQQVTRLIEDLSELYGVPVRGLEFPNDRETVAWVGRRNGCDLLVINPEQTENGPVEEMARHEFAHCTDTEFVSRNGRDIPLSRRMQAEVYADLHAEFGKMGEAFRDGRLSISEARASLAERASVRRRHEREISPAYGVSATFLENYARAP